MSAIERNPALASRTAYDLIVVGGGIHGACLSLEAARRGMRPLLLEKNDFGGATSANSLRVLHGGLRYLQSADLPRVSTSIRERRWFCRNFPDLVRPLPCLMPLHGRGLRRTGVMRSALALNDLFSVHRNRGVDPAAHLPRGRILSPAETAAIFPTVPRDGLVGSALWYDVIMTSSERIVVEILRWSAQLGATALNYVKAAGLRTTDGRTVGVEAVDHATGSVLDFDAPVVINCAGPWAPEVAAAFDSPAPGLTRRALAFNLLLNRQPIADAAIAVEPAGGGRMMFIVPWNGRVLAGTYHAPWPSSADEPVPAEAQIGDMLAHLNVAVPGLNARRQDVARVLAGFMPEGGAGDGTPSSRPVFIDHTEHGAPGLYSSVGVKFTTARDVAERALRRIFGHRPVLPGGERTRRDDTTARTAAADSADAWNTIIQQEAVVHLDDLLLRRTDWDPTTRPPAAAVAALATARGWDPTRLEQELKRLGDACRFGLETV